MELERVGLDGDNGKPAERTAVKSANRSLNDSDLCLRLPHNPEVAGSSPVSATRKSWFLAKSGLFPHFCVQYLTCHFFWPKRWPQRERIAERIIPHQRGCYPLSLPLHAWPRSLH